MQIMRIFTILVGINLIFVFLAYMNYSSDERILMTADNVASDPQNYSTAAFQDPTLAYQILQQLDVFEPYYNGWAESTWDSKYKGFYMGLKADDEYCDKHRAYFANDPSYVFRQSNYMSSYWPTDFFRKFGLDKVAVNAMPNTRYWGWYDPSIPAADILPNVSLIVTHEEMFYARHVMKQFSCLGQASNHIPGHSSLYRKDYVATGLIEYAKTFAARPQCFNFDKFFPKNYMMTDTEQCVAFFERINSTEYQEQKKKQNIVFMRKIGADVHAGKGVFPMDNEEEKYVREYYKNGEACGKALNNNIMQTFIHNPFLLKGRKSDFRVYMLIASTNPFIVYYTDGYFRVSLGAYNLTAADKSTLITNSAADSAFGAAKTNGTHNGMTHDELKEEHSWLFPRFQEYLLSTGAVNDTNWLQNYMQVECKKAIIHLVRMAQHTYLRRSSLYELYGLDFMFDEHLNLWFIEGNIQPGITEWTPAFTQNDGKMLQDAYSLIFGLIRSRMKRVYNYVNKLIMQGEATKLPDGTLDIRNLESRIEEFKEVSKNRWEPEFEPSADSAWSKVIDENYEGVERYGGLISEDCL